MAHPYEIQLTQLEAKPLAVVKDVAHAQNIGPKIGGDMPVVMAKLKELDVTDHGPVVVAYFPHLDGDWTSPPGIPIEVGVQLHAALATESPPLVRSSTPACRAATTLHTGPYQGLPAAHAAIHTWCRENGHSMTGHNWEIYGEHHLDDPTKLQTHVYYQLK